MTPVTFSCESVTESLLAEALPLLAQHWREIATHADIPLLVDTPTYLASQAAGIVRCYTVRTDALVGYALFFVRPHPHYAGSVQAAQDVVYLDPRLRGDGTGGRFLAYCDDQLAAEGVQVVSHHVKQSHPALGHALAALGYTPVETVYSRRLDVPSTTFEAPPFHRKQVGSVSWRPFTDLTDYTDMMRQTAGICDEDGG